MNNKIIILVVVLAAFIIGGVYYFSKSPDENQTQTISQPDFTESQSTTNSLPSSVNGIVTGKICSSSESGYIEAKRIIDGKFFIQNTPESTYSFELEPEKYHIRYVVGGIGDFATYSYNLDENDTVSEANVQRDKTLTYDLCETSTTDLESF